MEAIADLKKISVKALVLTPDTGTYRLPFKLGTERGTVK